MNANSRLLAIKPRSLLPIAAIVLASAIFVADTLTDLEIAVSVFYTAVVLIAVRFCSRRDVIFVGMRTPGDCDHLFQLIATRRSD